MFLHFMHVYMHTLHIYIYRYVYTVYIYIVHSMYIYIYLYIQTVNNDLLAIVDLPASQVRGWNSEPNAEGAVSVGDCWTQERVEKAG